MLFSVDNSCFGLMTDCLTDLSCFFLSRFPVPLKVDACVTRQPAMENSGVSPAIARSSFVYLIPPLERLEFLDSFVNPLCERFLFVSSV